MPRPAVTGLRTPAIVVVGAAGGRTSESTPVNIGPTIPAEKIEELMNVKGIGEKSFPRPTSIQKLLASHRALGGLVARHA